MGKKFKLDAEIKGQSCCFFFTAYQPLLGHFMPN